MHVYMGFEYIYSLSVMNIYLYVLESVNVFMENIIIFVCLSYVVIFTYKLSWVEKGKELREKTYSRYGKMLNVQYINNYFYY